MIQKGVSSPAPRRARASDARTRTRSSSSKASSASRSAYQVFPASPVRRSHSLPQTAIRGTPKKAAVNSSAFGRSERNKAPPCVEMWGPLGAKQKVAADTAPLHLRPGSSRVPRQAGVLPVVQRSRSCKSSEQTAGTPKKRVRAGSVGDRSDTSTASRYKAHVVNMEKEVQDMLQQSESVARYALEYGAANCLKAIAASYKVGRMCLMQCDSRIASLAHRITAYHHIDEGHYDFDQ